MKHHRGIAAVIAIVAWLGVTALLTTLGPYASVAALRGASPMPEETPGMPAATVSLFLETLGESGRAAYFRAQWLDMLIPLLAVVAAATVVTWSGGRTGMSDGLRVALMAPALLLACCEVLENVLLLAGRRAPSGAARRAAGTRCRDHRQVRVLCGDAALHDRLRRRGGDQNQIRKPPSNASSLTRSPSLRAISAVLPMRSNQLTPM